MSSSKEAKWSISYNSISYNNAKMVASLLVLTYLLLAFLFRNNLPVCTVFSDISITVAICLGAAGLIYALLNAGKQEKNVRLALTLMASGMLFYVLAVIVWTTLDGASPATVPIIGGWLLSNVLPLVHIGDNVLACRSAILPRAN